MTIALDDGDEDPLNDPILRDITDHMTRAIEEPGLAQSMAPFILWAAGDYIDKIRPITLHDTDIIYGVYRERMIEAQQKHLPQFKKSMAAED